MTSYEIFRHHEIREISENPRESARASLIELHMSENPARAHVCLADARIQFLESLFSVILLNYGFYTRNIIFILSW